MIRERVCVKFISTHTHSLFGFPLSKTGVARERGKRAALRNKQTSPVQASKVWSTRCFIASWGLRKKACGGRLSRWDSARCGSQERAQTWSQFQAICLNYTRRQKVVQVSHAKNTNTIHEARENIGLAVCVNIRRINKRGNWIWCAVLTQEAAHRKSRAPN